MSARDFELEIKNEWLAKGQDMEDLLHEIALFALRGIVKMSPVDTGRFRGNWVTSVGAADMVTKYDNVRPAGQSINEADTKLSASEGVKPIYIQNNLPYANRLENGYSRQAPAGMVAITIGNINATYNGKEI